MSPVSSQSQTPQPHVRTTQRFLGLYSSHVSICGSPVTYGWPLRTWWEGRQGFRALRRLFLLNNNKNPNITGMILGHLESPPSPRDPGNWSYAKHQSQRRQAWSQMGTREQQWPVRCGYLETDSSPHPHPTPRACPMVSMVCQRNGKTLYKGSGKLA